jgi:hypothetical protein
VVLPDVLPLDDAVPPCDVDAPVVEVDVPPLALVLPTLPPCDVELPVLKFPTVELDVPPVPPTALVLPTLPPVALDVAILAPDIAPAPLVIPSTAYVYTGATDITNISILQIIFLKTIILIIPFEFTNS